MGWMKRKKQEKKLTIRRKVWDESSSENKACTKRPGAVK